MGSHRSIAVLLAAALSAAACSGDRRATPTGPTAVAATAPVPSVTGGPATTSGNGDTSAGPSSAPAGVSAASSLSLPDEASASGPSAINFPPRNEPYDFRVRLESKYRDELRRSPVASYVDMEGTIVWTQEYLRYRLNGCPHVEAIARVFRQIDGFGVQPVCGAETPAFPPRNEPFDFRLLLEAKYRDGLRRGTTNTYVDPEGDIVWTQEYLRYRVSTCDHINALTRVFDQIDGRGVQPDCRSGSGSSGTVVSGVIGPWEIISSDWVIISPGTLSWVLTWPDRSVDLDLALTTSACNDPSLEECDILDLSMDVDTTREVVHADVVPGVVYRTWIANWDDTRMQPFRVEAIGGYVASTGRSTSAVEGARSAPVQASSQARARWKRR